MLNSGRSFLYHNNWLPWQGSVSLCWSGFTGMKNGEPEQIKATRYAFDNYITRRRFQSSSSNLNWAYVKEIQILLTQSLKPTQQTPFQHMQSNCHTGRRPQMKLKQSQVKVHQVRYELASRPRVLSTPLKLFSSTSMQR